MKKNIKLISMLVPTAAAVGMVVPLATSCVTTTATKKDEDKKSPSVRTLNMSNTTALNDIMNETTPFCAVNPNVYDTVNLTVTLPYDASSTLVLQYQTGKFYGDSIYWNGDWTQIASTEEETSHSFEIEHTKPIRFRAYHTNSADTGKFSTSTENPIKFNFRDSSIQIGGSLLSLVCTNTTGTESTWDASLELKGEATFNNLFNYAYAITEVSTNLLPFTTLTKDCYNNMFYHCDNMLTVPALPAMNLAEGCYQSMFSECYDMEVAPHLPAIKLAKSCYANMFYRCYDLKSISLGYVGNFISDSDNGYFTNWLQDAGYKVRESEGKGSIYYNGLDTEVSDSALPEDYEVIKNQDLITNKTVDITVDTDESIRDDGVATSKILGSKKQFRAYKGQTVADLNAQLPESAPNTGVTTTNPLVLYDDQGTKLTDTKAIEDVSNATLLLSYYKEPVVVAGYVNVIGLATTTTNKPSSKSTKITLDQKAENAGTIYYKKGTEETWTTFNEGDAIKIEEGETLQIKGNIGSVTDSDSGHTKFKITGKAKLEGDPRTLLTDDGTIPETMPDYAFCNLFASSTGITEVSEDFLPATTLSKYCYKWMFTGCTSLVKAPIKLEAQTLTDGCYACMFYGDTSLTTVPELPATTAAAECYDSMFYGCSSLVTAPALPATTLGEKCYYFMFYECTNLKSGPDGWELPATNIPYAAYERMFYGCSSLTSAPKISAKTLADGKYVSNNEMYGSMHWMFYNCTSLETAPVMKDIENVGTYGMNQMFYGCTKLADASTIKLGQGSLKMTHWCFKGMFSNCTALTKAPDMLGLSSSQNTPSSTNAQWCSNMFQWCTNLGASKSGSTKFLNTSWGLSTLDTNNIVYYMFSTKSGSSTSHSSPDNNTSYYYG